MGKQQEQQAAAAAAEGYRTKPVVDQSEGFIAAVMRQKQIDHEASHSNLCNQFLHLLSSALFVVDYWWVCKGNMEYLELAMYTGLFSLIIRQAGHYIFEPPCHDKEQAMLGFDTQNKVRIVLLFAVVPAMVILQALTSDLDISLAQAWLVVTFSIVFGRVALLWYRYGFMVSMHWWVKFMTDPFTDIPAYWKSGYQIFNPTLLKGALHESFPNTVAKPQGYVRPASGYDHVKAH
eukprot:CAMPEP_0202081654 /NCGR_PEP_ID=MMETSP0964-20121228/15315_1 /ASSEMBLY_ACC=CAM_ASM_000500 /TAXON_ID=4773 /ORGANISM="Schizochytrium aggregatum, Strain ATCC28209" /LENGTH=233 /DNA_ID=CAMNT_0048649225 /DNA_START=36 /DNA_END=737 /DNA_ORIENTATION=+